MRSMICDDVNSRSSRGLSTMKPRPVLAVCAPPVLPVNVASAATSGSCMITSPIFCMSRIISSGAVSCAASRKADIMPVSWIGKNPFGIWIASTRVNAMVAKKTASVIAWWRSTMSSVRR